MKSLQKHYKVVQRFGGNLYSFNIKPQFGAEERGTCMLYTPHTWTVPKIKHSKLFIFKKLDYALLMINRFVDSRGWKNFEVWECEVKKPEPLDIMSADLCACEIEEIEQQWRLGLFQIELETPSGTIAASKVKLIKRVLSESEILNYQSTEEQNE
jgi:hypothetical protein